MELYPGAHQISSLYKDGRSLFQYLLIGARILVDGGWLKPQKSPFFLDIDQLELDPERSPDGHHDPPGSGPSRRKFSDSRERHGGSAGLWRGRPASGGRSGLSLSREIQLFAGRTWRRLGTGNSSRCGQPLQGDEIRDFFNDSRKTVDILDRKIMRALSQSRAGLTQRELMDAAMEEFPDWPVSTRALSVFPMKGHLGRLENRGQVRMDRQPSPPRWRVA